MIQALKDESDDVRSQSAKVLGKIGPATVDQVLALIQLLEDDYHYVRSSTAEALERLKNKS